MAKSATQKKTAPKKVAYSKNNSSDFEPLDSKMGATSASDENGLQKLFLDSIKDIYWAENHLVKSLPKLINAASAAELKSAINDHLDVTVKHVSRLEEIFKLLGKKPQAKKCDAMEGLSKEGESVIESTDAGTTIRDQGIIMASQKTEYYEISSYRGLIKLASALGFDNISEIMERTLVEEQEADDILSSLAEELLVDYANSSKGVPQ